MNILVIGEEANLKECQSKFTDKHNYLFADTHEEAKQKLSKADVIFDFIIERESVQREIYGGHSEAFIFLNTSRLSLGQLQTSSKQPISSTTFGFAGLPTFLDRKILEVSLFKPEQEPGLSRACKELGTPYQIVDDRVGLVTPRIICMIINEAYYTVQEGTASKEDIDLAMKLGTSYPYGPFEWCKKIGVRNIYELLSAIHEDTKDERYKICPLLKREYLLTQP